MEENDQATQKNQTYYYSTLSGAELDAALQQVGQAGQQALQAAKSALRAEAAAEIVAMLVQEMVRARIQPNDTLDNPPLPYLRSEIYLEMVRIFLRGLLSQDKIKEYDENIT